MLQAVIDDILRRGTAEMEDLVHFSGARGIDVDKLACSSGTACAGPGYSSLVGRWDFSVSYDVSKKLDTKTEEQ